MVVHLTVTEKSKTFIFLLFVQNDFEGTYYIGEKSKIKGL